MKKDKLIMYVLLALVFMWLSHSFYKDGYTKGFKEGTIKGVIAGRIMGEHNMKDFIQSILHHEKEVAEIKSLQQEIYILKKHHK